MTDSPHYTDHLIAALRCLDDDNLRKLSHEIMGRLAQNCLDDCTPSEAEILETARKLGHGPNPDKCKLTLEEKLEYVAKLKLEYAQQDEFEKRVNRNLEP